MKTTKYLIRLSWEIFAKVLSEAFWLTYSNLTKHHRTTRYYTYENWFSFRNNTLLYASATRKYFIVSVCDWKMTISRLISPWRYLMPFMHRNTVWIPFLFLKLYLRKCLFCSCVLPWNACILYNENIIVLTGEISFLSMLATLIQQMQLI